jgi:IS4 transposase
VKIAERMVDVSHCEKKVRAIAVKEKGKTHIEIWLSNIPAAAHSAKGIIDEYRNRWGIEVFFKEEKSYWYLNNLPSRKLEAVKCTIYGCGIDQLRKVPYISLTIKVSMAI